VLLLLIAQRKVKQREGHALGWWAVVRLAGRRDAGSWWFVVAGRPCTGLVKEEVWYGVVRECGKQQPCA
jgi:hypothetical protein